MAAPKKTAPKKTAAAPKKTAAPKKAAAPKKTAEPKKSAPAPKTAAAKSKSGGGVQFRDWGLRLAVLSELHTQGMFEKEFEAAAEAAQSAEEYTISEKARAILDGIALTPDVLAKVTSLSPDGGDEAYAALTSEWDGEDDLFDIKSFEDVGLLPNLASVTLIAMVAKGIDVSPLARAPKLKTFRCHVSRSWVKGLETLEKLRGGGRTIEIG